MENLNLLNRKNRLRIGANYILILLVGSLQILYPVYISKIIDELYKAAPAIGKLLAVAGVLILGKVLVGLVNTIYSSRVYWDISSQLKYGLSAKIIDIDCGQVKRFDIDSLTQTIGNDTQQFVDFYVTFAGILIKDIFIITGVIVIAFKSNLPR